LLRTNIQIIESINYLQIRVQSGTVFAKKLKYLLQIVNIFLLIISLFFSLNLYGQVGPNGTGTVGGYYIGPGADLSGADLSGAILDSADLSGADLSGAYLLFTHLRDADLSGVLLNGADLTITKLGGANLIGADLTGAILRHTNLEGAILDEVKSGNIDGTPTLPSGYQMVSGFIVGPNVNLTSADLSGVDLSDTDLTGANLIDANLDGITSGNIDGTPILPSDYQLINGFIVGPNVKISDADLSGVDLSGANLTGIMSWNIVGTPTLPSDYQMVKPYIVGPNVNLTNANFDGADLSNTVLTGTDLSNANLTRADLSNAALTSANLLGANLDGVMSGNIIGTPTLPSGYQMVNGYIIGPKVNLSNADLTGADLSNADLSNANLSSVNLSSVNLSGADLNDANLSGANSRNTDLSGADLRNADLSGVILSDADLSEANLIDADLSSADLSGANLENADLGGAELTDADLSDANLDGVKSGSITRTPTLPSGYQMINGYIIGPKVNLSNAGLYGADLRNADLSGADLSGANLNDANLMEAILTDTDVTDTDFSSANLLKANLNDSIGVSSYNDFNGAILDVNYINPAAAENYLNFKFIGTNNHDFSDFINVPAILNLTEIPTHPLGTDFGKDYSVVETLVSWIVPGGSSIGGTQYGRPKITIGQNSYLSEYLLKMKFMYWDDLAYTYIPLGNSIIVDGFDLLYEDLTATLGHELEVSNKRGLLIKVWKEAKPVQGDTKLNLHYFGTNNDDLGPYLENPISLDIFSIPTADKDSDLHSYGNVVMAEFSNADLSYLSQYGKGKVTIGSTSLLTGYNLKFRYFIEQPLNPAGFTAWSPIFSIDGDELANGDVTAQAASGGTVNTHTGFQLRVWKEAKTELELVGGTDGGDDATTASLNITFIGTNNHDFSTLMSAPVAFDTTTIPEQPAGSDQNGFRGNIAIAQFTSPNSIGGSPYGKGRLTIAQTNALAGYVLKARFFKADSANESGYTSSGPIITIDGDALALADVTGEAASGMGVSTQTGFEVRVWKEAKATSEPEPEPEPEPENTGDTNTGNAGDSTNNTDDHSFGSWKKKHKLWKLSYDHGMHTIGNEAFRRIKKHFDKFEDFEAAPKSEIDAIDGVETDKAITAKDWLDVASNISIINSARNDGSEIDKFADDDKDGVGNLLEYVFDTDPETCDNGVKEILYEAANKRLKMKHSKNQNVQDVQIDYYWSINAIDYYLSGEADPDGIVITITNETDESGDNVATAEVTLGDSSLVNSIFIKVKASEDSNTGSQ
jgi:uncharacterized protein YjbI with pentapeptide repeats